MRINQYISHSTTYSRREAEKLVLEGRIKIGQKVIKELSVEVGEDDKVFLDGKPIKIKTEYTVIVYNKPKGEIVSKSDRLGRKLIYDSLPSGFAHYRPIGRLDFASEGLLLLTDSPKVATALMESNLERVYKLKIDGSIPQALEDAMQKGLELSDAKAGGHEKSEITDMNFAPFFAYQIIKNDPRFSKLKVAIGEGKNRELRRFFAHFKREVMDLKRLSYGGVELNALPGGKWRYLSKKEYEGLRGYLKKQEDESKQADKPQQKPLRTGRRAQKR